MLIFFGARYGNLSWTAKISTRCFQFFIRKCILQSIVKITGGKKSAYNKQLYLSNANEILLKTILFTYVSFKLINDDIQLKIL